MVHFYGPLFKHSAGYWLYRAAGRETCSVFSKTVRNRLRTALWSIPTHFVRVTHHLLFRGKGRKQISVPRNSDFGTETHKTYPRLVIRPFTVLIYATFLWILMRDLFLHYNSPHPPFPQVRVPFLSFKREFKLGCYSPENQYFNLCVNRLFIRNLDMACFSLLRKCLWYRVMQCQKIVLAQKLEICSIHKYIHGQYSLRVMDQYSKRMTILWFKKRKLYLQKSTSGRFRGGFRHLPFFPFLYKVFTVVMWPFRPFALHSKT